jgi:hypothetical protein
VGAGVGAGVGAVGVEVGSGPDVAEQETVTRPMAASPV